MARRTRRAEARPAGFVAGVVRAQREGTPPLESNAWLDVLVEQRRARQDSNLRHPASKARGESGTDEAANDDLVQSADGEGIIEPGMSAAQRTLGADDDACGKPAASPSGWSAARVALAKKFVAAALTRLDSGDVTGARELLVSVVAAES